MVLTTVKFSVIIKLCATIICVLGAVGVLLSYVSNHNFGNFYERQIVHHYTKANNARAYAVKRISQMAKVEKSESEKLESIINSSFLGGTGDNRHAITWKLLVKNGYSIDPKLYSMFTEILESSSKDFNESRSELMFSKRIYLNAINSYWQGKVLSYAGYPSINVGEYDIAAFDDIIIRVNDDTSAH